MSTTFLSSTSSRIMLTSVFRLEHVGLYINKLLNSGIVQINIRFTPGLVRSLICLKVVCPEVSVCRFQIVLFLQELYETMNRELSCIAANILAVAASKNETVKDTFMDLKADEAIVQYLRNHAEEMGSDGAALQAACDAIRALTVADDDRPAASNVMLMACYLNDLSL